MELTAEVIKRYHLDILKCATLEEKQKMFLSQVRNNKDFAVLQHRKMWIWIAQQYAKGRKIEVANLKREYIKEYCFDTNIKSRCFCCEYSENKADLLQCLKCPILWKNGNCSVNDNSEYGLMIKKSHILCDNPIPEDIEGFLKSPYFKTKRQYILVKRSNKAKEKMCKVSIQDITVTRKERNI